VYFDGGSKASFYCNLRYSCKNSGDRFGLSKHLKKVLTTPYRKHESCALPLCVFQSSPGEKARPVSISISHDPFDHSDKPAIQVESFVQSEREHPLQ